MPKNWKDDAKKVIGATLVVAGLGIGGWIFLILIDLLFFAYLFYAFDNLFQDYGLQEYLAKGIAVLFSGSICYFIGTVLKNIFKRNKAWIPILSGFMIACFAVMYLLSSPYGNNPFNIFSGLPGKYYRDQYGKINRAPRGAKVGPNGEAVDLFNKDIAEEYQRQRRRQGKPETKIGEENLFERLMGSFTAKDEPTVEYAYKMKVEKIEIWEDRTIVHLAVSRAVPDQEGRLPTPQGENYIVDDTGQAYDLREDKAEYMTWKNRGGLSYYIRVIRPDETYRFVNIYKGKLKSEAKSLKMYDSRFDMTDLTNQLSQALLALEKWKKEEAEKLEVQRVSEQNRAEIWAAQERAAAEAKAADGKTEENKPVEEKAPQADQTKPTGYPIDKSVQMGHAWTSSNSPGNLSNTTSGKDAFDPSKVVRTDPYKIIFDQESKGITVIWDIKMSPTRIKDKSYDFWVKKIIFQMSYTTVDLIIRPRSSIYFGFWNNPKELFAQIIGVIPPTMRAGFIPTTIVDQGDRRYKYINVLVLSGSNANLNSIESLRAGDEYGVEVSFEPISRSIKRLSLDFGGWVIPITPDNPE